AGDRRMIEDKLCRAEGLCGSSHSQGVFDALHGQAGHLSELDTGLLLGTLAKDLDELADLRALHAPPDRRGIELEDTSDLGRAHTANHKESQVTVTGCQGGAGCGIGGHGMLLSEKGAMQCHGEYDPEPLKMYHTPHEDATGRTTCARHV